MGITVQYRGQIADLGRVEEFEDRVVDLALEIGGAVQIWRSGNDDPRRIVRGVLLDLSPGQETTSLLLSPDGWLIPICDIKAAESGAIATAPHCLVKTQFGAIEGHVALIELLDGLKCEFFPNLEVLDESGYRQHRDANTLVENFAQAQAALGDRGEGLRRTSLSPEALEDPKILATRIERVARQVRQTLARPPEHPPVGLDDGDGEETDELDELDEAAWDALYKENRRRQERLQRAIKEQMRQGRDAGEALEHALRSEGITDLPGEDEPELEEEWDASSEVTDESWRESLTPEISDPEEQDSFERERHPLQQAAMDLLMRLHDIFADDASDSSHISTLLHGAGEMMGGLAQALPRSDFGDDRTDRGLALVQLKRALRGAAFAKGALFPLRSAGGFDQHFAELTTRIKAIEDGVFTELHTLRG